MQDMRTVHLCGETLPHPGHVCAFFDSRDQKYETLIPFTSDAIAAGDDVINIVDAPDTTAHLDLLSRGGVPVQDALRTGQLSVYTSEQTYLQERENALSSLLVFLREALERADRENHCLRTWGEMNWVERGIVPLEDVLEYEAKVNEIVPHYECSLLCVYDLAHTPASLMSEILLTHPYAILNGRLRKNSFYVQPKEYLEMLRSRRS
jgi:hypothetical protein